MSIDLSKSKYCKGIQCPKILWMDEYKPEEASNILPESVMANGNMVGDLARQYFREYELVEFNYNKSVMAGKTSELMNSGTANIAEAAFYTDGLYCAVDILHRVGDASAAFADMPNHTPDEIAVMRNDLLNYCCLDTLAMVKVLEKLRNVSAASK